jgi:hypothetical protein
MYGNVYTSSSSSWTSGAKFGSSFTWDGTHYTLVDATVTTPNSTHHYSCNSTDENAVCESLRYVYYGTGTKYYVTLTGGDGIEEALTKMQTNTNNSNIKNKIDIWYINNMTGVTSKLEDTIWCNDRSFGDNNNNGWIANGGSLSTYLFYGAKERSADASNNSSKKNQPSLICINKNDRFTVSNTDGNGALTYPVALLTEDEIVLAGGLYDSKNAALYLKTGGSYWTMSPYRYTNNLSIGFTMYNSGDISYTNLSNNNGVRPSISLKPGQLIKSGTGTVADPYVIE